MKTLQKAVTGGGGLFDRSVFDKATFARRRQEWWHCLCYVRPTEEDMVAMVAREIEPLNGQEPAGTTAGAAGIRHPPSSFHVYADHLFPRLDQALFLPRKDTDPKHRSSVSRRQSSQSTRRSFTGTDGGARAPVSRRNSFRQQRTTDSVVPLPVREICFDGICVDGTCVDGTCFDVLMVHVLMVHDDTCAAYFLYMMVVFFV